MLLLRRILKGEGMSDNLVLGTKAETLKCLEGRLQNAAVLPQVSFTVKDWRQDLVFIENALLDLRKKSASGKLIVRSSALDEDAKDTSQAGKYLSVPGITDFGSAKKAIEEVIGSYGNDDPDNQVLIQPELNGVRYCGVAFTMDPGTRGFYDVVEFDVTGSTSAVTSGDGGEHVLFYHHKDTPEEEIQGGAYQDELKRIFRMLRELEGLFGQENLDTEFAFTEEGNLYLLQVRTLVLTEEGTDRKKQFEELLRIRRKIAREQQPKPFLCGKKTIYSVMTDWNPAEMIGTRPHQLALSLYQEIITDSIWAYQRDNYGYRNLRSVPLMVDFGGLPYIDVRASFNSFIPAELNEELSEKLVNYYLKRLEEDPSEHDKAEFHIVFSCYTFDLPERIRILRNYGFSDGEVDAVMDSLRNVTNRIIDHETGLWRKDYGKIEKLAARYELIMNSSMSRVEKVYWLIEDCKRYGTLPFAGLARAAFIAVQLLRSMVTVGILTDADYEAFINGVNTVSSQMNADFIQLSKTAFLEKYGHLRPGTYDITSPRYDQAPDLYFDWEHKEEKTDPKREDFRLSMEQMQLLKEKLEQNGLTNDVLSILNFIKKVVEGREYGKFIFTKSVSKALELIGEIGAEEGFSREDCSFLNVKIFQHLYASAQDIKTAFEESIVQGKNRFKMTASLMLPPVISSPNEVMSFFYPDSQPNYITSGRVSGEVLELKGNEIPDDLSGKIILIEGADPGYDWIFSRGICGFITMYGGANSHMAIRAGELAIPAAVGVGGKLYENIRLAKTVEIDAGGRTIKRIR